MEFVLLAIALGLAAGVAGVRLSIGAHGRIRAVQRLHDRQLAAARRRIADLEGAACDVEARLFRAQAVEAAGRRTHTALLAAFSREMRGPLDAILASPICCGSMRSMSRSAVVRVRPSSRFTMARLACGLWSRG